MLLCLSSGGLGEVLVVALGELAVVASACFECCDACWCDAEGACCCGDGDAGSEPVSAEVFAVGHLGWVGEQSVDLSGDVPLDAAHDLASGLAFGAAPCCVVDGALVDAEADHGDAPQGVVGLPVAASVQPVADVGAR